MSDIQTLIENRPPSVAALFLERVAATPDAEAYRYPVPSGTGPDEWKSLSWAESAPAAPSRACDGCNPLTIML